MSTLLAFITFLIALISAPSAFLLLWFKYKLTRENYIRSIAYSMLGLTAILAGNVLNFLLENNPHYYDLRIAFIIMNEVFLGSVISSTYFCRFAHESTGLNISARHKLVFWTFSILFFFLFLVLSMFTNSNGGIDISRGYLITTLYGNICQGYATVLLLLNRKKLEPLVALFLPPFLIILTGLGLLSVMNDIFHFGNLLGGPNLAFSPIILFLVCVLIVLFFIKELSQSKKSKTDCAEPNLPQLGLTDREQEVLPLLLEGISNEDIAGKLFISPHTVKNHVTAILRKAGVTNRFELLKRMTGKNE